VVINITVGKIVTKTVITTVAVCRVLISYAVFTSDKTVNQLKSEIIG